MSESEQLSGLPVLSILAELKNNLAANNDVVLSAPPGSGKTTGIPPSIYHENWLDKRKIIMLEPRRLAARMAASRIAELLGEPVGKSVGYRIRLETNISKNTRIEVVTEGILTRLLQNDPALEEYGLVIFDEFHERSIHADLAFALCLDSKKNLREDLRLLVMSATLDVEGVSNILQNPVMINAEGRSFPVEIIHDTSVKKGGRSDSAIYNGRMLIDQMTTAIFQTVDRQPGGILAFLPGAWEINSVAEALIELGRKKDIHILPLHGSLPKKAQDQAVLPQSSGNRKIVLATPIAETSLTIEGISTVIDCGWARVPRFDAGSGLTRLETRRISKASAQQRAGRAGRLGPGVCYRLWDSAVDHSMLSHTPPEILETDLAQFVLELFTWGVREPEKLQWLDPPPKGHFEQARKLLSDLGVFDRNGGINDIGKKMATLPLHPRLARMIIKADELGRKGSACDIAAILSERDIIIERTQRTTDLEKRFHTLAAFRLGDNPLVLANGAGVDSCRRVDQTSREWQRRLTGRKKARDISLGGLLAFAYPDRLAKLRDKSRNRYLLANGRGAKLPPGDILSGSTYLVIPHLDAAKAEGRIYLAAQIDPADIEEYHRRLISDHQDIFWDLSRQAVSARLQKRIDKLVIESRKLKNPAQEELMAAMLDGIRQMGIGTLPWDKKARELQARILSLRIWQPDVDWPDLSDDNLDATPETWLSPYLNGITKRDQLTRLNLTEIFLNQLDWRMRQTLESLAPTHITAPSGSNIRLHYTPGEPPVMAVRLQEMFGLADTPTVCSGKVPVMLHLLSPANRPMQVTQDLRGFWNGTYNEVKKELKGRYPKHHWPDDPWSAQPTARAKRRK